MKIAMFIGSLRGGGAERVFAMLADALAGLGYEVALVTLADVGSDFFCVSNAVRRMSLKAESESASVAHGILANLRRMIAIRRALEELKPDVVISFMTSMNVLVAIAAVGSQTPLILSERVDPSQHDIGSLWSLLRRLTYPRASALVVQTSRIAHWFQTRRLAGAQIAVIANPVVDVSGGRPRRVYAARRIVFGAGRLERQKGFDLLLDAFAQYFGHDESIELRIAGRGSQESALRSQAIRLGIGGRVHFLGQVANIADEMDMATVFVLASRYEGFPNVLLEALAHGVPVVATDCPTGPRDVLGDCGTGILVPTEDASALGAAIARVMGDADLAARLSEAGPRAVRRYGVGEIANQWAELLTRVAPAKRS